jgi:hypothetical protein
MAYAEKWNRWTLSDEDANAILEFTSFVQADFRDEGRVASEPIEEGSFAAYNKTDSPLDAYVTLGIQGEPDELQDALDKLRALKKETATFSVITPEQEYEKITLESFNYTRKREDGLNSLYVELHLVEVREIAPQYSTVALPAKKCRNSDNASKVNAGKSQATETPPYNSILSGKGNG